MVQNGGDLLSDWQQFNSYCHHKMLLLPQPPPENGTLIKETEWSSSSLVFIKDSPPDSLLNSNTDHYNNGGGVSIFPPINHENLHLHESDDLSSKKSCFYHELEKKIDPIDLDTALIKPDPPLIKPDPSSDSSSEAVKSSNRWWVGINSSWLGFWLQILTVKVYRVVARSSLYRWWCNKARDFRWVFPHASGVAAVAAVLWWLSRRVLRRRMSRLDRMMIGIKERDEQIIQLLTQIVQMNESLLAHQKIPPSKSTN